MNAALTFEGAGFEMFELLVGHDSFLLDPLVAPFSLFTQEV
jgi:hypothetical protein